MYVLTSHFLCTLTGAGPVGHGGYTLLFHLWEGKSEFSLVQQQKAAFGVNFTDFFLLNAPCNTLAGAPSITIFLSLL